MGKEAEIRMDPCRRAERFGESWQQLPRQREYLARGGDLRGAKQVAQNMAGMAKSLERDAQLESVLGGRSRELGLEISRDLGRSLSRDLANSIPFDHGRDLGRCMGMGL